jgi:hypothetical protein
MRHFDGIKTRTIHRIFLRLSGYILKENFCSVQAISILSSALREYKLVIMSNLSGQLVMFSGSGKTSMLMALLGMTQRNLIISQTPIDVPLDRGDASYADRF